MAMMRRLQQGGLLTGLLVAPLLRGSVAGDVAMRGAGREAAGLKSAIVFVGSAQCDWDDSTCRPGQPTTAQERIVYAVEVSADGSLKPRPELSVDVGGVPAWVTAAQVAGVNCLFVSRLDKDDILGLPLSSDTKPELPGSSAPAGGQFPVFSAVAEGDTLLGANYGSNEGASAVSYHIGSGCSLQLAQSIPHHGGSNVVPWRQADAHTHGVLPTKDGLAYACDLGMDTVFVYKLLSDGQLQEQGRVQTPAGCGPRHAVLHPEKPFVYVLCELSQAVLTFHVSAQSPLLTLAQTSSLLPQGASAGGSKAGEIVMLPDGSSLYASNRQVLNTITGFAIDKDNGLLKKAQEVPAPAFPRGMTLALGGKLLLVAGQSKTELVSYRVLPGGRLKATGHSLTTGLPPFPASLAVMR
eukprot:CAMPEP_0203968742 /NCGR_PEP_ID=MMETSP0359-20131031/97102_1 /ASSEMBLY_ACC=CAM_ASM_000338 /TAXON_ID=268821 /ORGANISM="Scrippsiella Hangoei, Strain SHTV-5" /LENGTH=409 /DNA_ID=CAMNT_0050906669 /DNA_START=74 /DNA_END=1303 /DNA_ORIENTATION=-